MWIMLPLSLLGILLSLGGLFAIAYDTRCQQCERPFAVFSIRGLLRIRLRVCRRCRRAHLARRRNYAR